MKRWLYSVLVCLVVCVGCQWQMRPADPSDDGITVSIERFDRMEMLYLSTGDLAALQQMKTNYPTETRTLIEDVLRLGRVDEADINRRFLLFFQDSTLQSLMADVARQYQDVDDLDGQLTEAFNRLARSLPDFEMPRFYTQVGSLDQSIVVGHGVLGISLDKYLGTDHPIYLKYGYSKEQRAMMTRDYIVPDCLSFYLLSRYPLSPVDVESPELRRMHMGRIQWVVNKALGHTFFNSEAVSEAQTYMQVHPATDWHTFLSSPLPSTDTLTRQP